MIWIILVSIIGLLFLFGFLIDRHDKSRRYYNESHPNSQAHIRHMAQKEAESRTTAEHTKTFE